MNISALTAPQVWTSSARSLTNFGASALTNGGNNQATLAASATVDLRPSATVFAMTTAAAITGTSPLNPVQILLYDGANSIACAKSGTTTNSPTGFSMFSNHSQGCAVFNQDSTVAGNYISSSLLWSQ